MNVQNGDIEEYEYNPFGIDEFVMDDFTSNTDKWYNYTAGYTGTLSRVYDNELESNVMKGSSSYATEYGVAIGYPSGNYQIKRAELSLKCKPIEQMQILVLVRGKDGNDYYLSYANASSGAYVSGNYYYIPVPLRLGEWNLLERNVVDDFEMGFNTEFDYISAVLIRGGNYYVDDLIFKGRDLSDNNRKYADEDQDGTGLYYLRSRYYDPELGRFISADSYHGNIADPLSLNRYIYVKNNPLKYVDPSGHVPIMTEGEGDINNTVPTVTPNEQETYDELYRLNQETYEYNSEVAKEMFRNELKEDATIVLDNLYLLIPGEVNPAFAVIWGITICVKVVCEDITDWINGEDDYVPGQFKSWELE